ncbi:APC family permease [Candidatus Paracaedibacter symbiosus]|uniref:APC family permease n=1 Tax=Candidatus Paracaedibacter symbiosus TaxID=244582 RepID=UPI0005096C2C|nr:APC family permease [Candidatus Paracaedibacter symbiosus]
MAEETKLATGSLGTAESIIMGISGTAPAFSAAATTTALVAAVGIHSPSSILYCGLIMFGVTFSFMYLNRISANAGASYTWISTIFNKNLGFFAGWSLLVASALFMVSGTIPAATSTLALLNPQMVNDPMWVTLIAAGWLTIISAIILKGIRPTSYLQVILTIIEVSILIFIIIAAFVTFIQQPAHIITIETFNPFNFSLELFAKGALISLFFFWGWDVTMNLTEETKNPNSAPGKAALWSMIITILLFVAFVMCALIALTDQEIQQSGTNVLLQIANKILPSPWGNIALICVILSSIGTIETSILQFTRTIFATSRDGALHKRWSKVHNVWQTPWTATLLIWALGMVFLIVASQEPTVSAIIDISINVISFQVAFYYSLCGFACAWYYRAVVLQDFSKTLLLIIWPLISAFSLISIAIYGALNSFDKESILLGIGGIAIGIFPLVMNRYLIPRTV